jgi:DNA-binding NtrC family response regulator
VRELKSAVERGILISDGESVSANDLMIHGTNTISAWEDRISLADAAETNFVNPPQPEVELPSTNGSSSYETPNLEPLGGDGQGIVSLEDLKHRAVEHAYRRCDGNVDRAAVELGIGRATMYRLLKKYQLMS